MDDLHVVQQVFPTVERWVLEGALVFKTAEPTLRFYATNSIALRDRPSDGSHRARLLPHMHDRIETIIEQEGAFVVPKSVGFFMCMLESPLVGFTTQGSS